jgi:hypothetical protein
MDNNKLKELIIEALNENNELYIARTFFNKLYKIRITKDDLDKYTFEIYMILKGGYRIICKNNIDSIIKLINNFDELYTYDSRIAEFVPNNVYNQIKSLENSLENS